MSQQDFKPGDVISRPWGDGRIRYVVQDPVRTSHGKLRLWRAFNEDLTTTCWTPGNLPAPYVLEREKVTA